MARVAFREAATQRLASQSYRFTVVFQPVVDETPSTKKNGRRRPRSSTEAGYQVTVPLLPGLITYGRTLAEAREMAADAIRVHIEGLRKDGEPIPDERTTRTEKLCVALSA
jgi:antitoxin HicB